MRPETVLALNALNRRFYRERASEFSATRERPWPGWKEIFDRIGSLLPARPRVLDVGCGNGRFARFVDERLPGIFEYSGVDASPRALEEARRRLGARENLSLFEHDFLSAEDPLPPGVLEREFDLVALFGVIHHVPGRDRRLELLSRLSRSLAPSGLLVFSLWRFDRHARFRSRIAHWREAGVPIDLSDLEPGDHLLRWGKDPPALRYCHAMSESEEAALARALPLELLEKIEDVPEPNAYFVFRSEPQPKTA